MSVKPGCQCLDQNCDICFEMSVDYCPASINIDAGQTPGAQVYLWILDKLGNYYNELVVVNGDGSIDIPLANFPVGMFTPTFGAVNIFLTSDADGNIVLPMGTLYPNETFNCILLRVDEPVYLTDDSGCFLLTDDDGNILIAQ